jgi:RNA polymerase sigma-70 factor (ECF subfamily)
MADHALRADIAQLVAEHHAALYRYAYRLSGSTADAEDLVQQTFLVAHTHVSQVRSEDSIRSWLYAVLRNAWCKSCRQRTPAIAGDLELALESIPEELPDGPSIDRDELQAALDALPEEFKVVLLMFYFEHRSYKDIAEQLKLPMGTVMSRLSRGKIQLRNRLFPETAHEGPAPTRKPRTARVNP